VVVELGREIAERRIDGGGAEQSCSAVPSERGERGAGQEAWAQALRLFG